MDKDCMAASVSPSSRSDTSNDICIRIKTLLGSSYRDTQSVRFSSKARISSTIYENESQTSIVSLRTINSTEFDVGLAETSERRPFARFTDVWPGGLGGEGSGFGPGIWRLWCPWLVERQNLLNEACVEFGGNRVMQVVPYTW